MKLYYFWTNIYFSSDMFYKYWYRMKNVLDSWSFYKKLSIEPHIIAKQFISNYKSIYAYYLLSCFLISPLCFLPWIVSYLPYYYLSSQGKFVNFCKLLAQPCSSSCGEKNWSTDSFIHSLKRNKIPHGAEVLVYVHSNLR